MVWEEGPIHLKQNVSAEWGMPLILFRYEKSPIIYKWMCNIYKNWTLASPLNDASYGRPASVFTNCPRLCPCVTGFVDWFLPAPWMTMAANRSVKGSIRHMVLVFGESLSWVFFFSSLIWSICAESHFSPASEWSLIFGMRVGEEVCFFFWSILHCYPRKKIYILSVERLPGAPRQGCLEGESVLSSLRIFGDNIWIFTCDF